MHQPWQAVEYVESKDYLNPIIADADTGHGGITATMKLAKMFIENGAAGIHIEDGWKRLSGGIVERV